MKKLNKSNLSLVGMSANYGGAIEAMAVDNANKAEERVWWELVDIPKDPEVEQLKQVVADLTEFVLFGGVE